MNFTVEKAQFSKMLGLVSAVADKKDKTSCILVEAKKNIVVLSATDLISTVQRKIEASTKAEGSFAVDASLLSERIKAMPNGPVNLTVKDMTLTIKAVGAARKYTIQVRPAEDFPMVPSIETELANKIPKEVFLNLAKSVQNAIGTDTSRANINSALLEWHNGKVSLTGTDGHALVHASTPLDVAGGQEVLLPKTAIDQLAKMIAEAKDESEKEVSVAFNGSHAVFEVGNSRFVTSIPEAKFPAYRQVIPQGRKDFVPVNKARMIEACKAISIATSKGIDGGVVFDIEGGKVKLLASSSDKGTAYDEIPTDYAGKPKRVCIQASLVVNNMANLPNDEVLLSIEGELDAVLLSVKGDDGVLGVMMPMRE